MLTLHGVGCVVVIRIFRERLVKLMGSGASVDMALVSKFKAEDGKTLRQLIGDVHG